MAGYQPPNYTQIPNVFLDEHMQDMTEAELKVVLFAMRKTFGWHKQEDEISYSQFMQGTKLSRQAVRNALEAAIKRGIMVKVGEGKRGVGRYQVNVWSMELTSNDNELVNNLDQNQSTINTSTSLQSRHTKESIKEKEKKKELSTIVDEQPDDIYTWDVLITTVRDTFQVYGANERHIANMLMGRSKKGKWGEYKCDLDLPLDKMIQAVLLFKHWYADATDGLTIPQEADKINSWFTRFIQSDEGKQWRKMRGGAILSAWLRGKRQVDNAPQWDAQEHQNMVDELYKEIVG